MMRNECPLRLSIVVPVYNVEKYLERCILSLLHQDLSQSDYEIIIVNDGSTDKSYEIAKKYKEQNSNVILLTQVNKGLSGARNTALKHVSGKYVMYVDSDDFLEENVVGKLLEKAERQQTDLLFFLTVYEYKDGSQIIGKKWKFSEEEIYTGEFLLLHGFEVSSVWRCVYSSSFLNRNDIFFTEGIVHEDIDYNFRIYPLAERVMFSSLYVYHYSVYGGSLLHTNNPLTIKKQIYGDLYVINSIRSHLSEAHYSKEVRKMYIRHTNSIAVSTLLRLIRDRCLPLKDKLECVDLAKQLGIYPVRGCTNSWLTSFLKNGLNWEWGYKYLLRSRR